MKCEIWTYPHLAKIVQEAMESTSYGQKFGFNTNKYVSENITCLDSQFLKLMKCKAETDSIMTRTEVEHVCKTMFDFMIMETEENADKLRSCIDKNGMPQFLWMAWHNAMFDNIDGDESYNMELCRKLCRYIRRDIMLFTKLSAIVCNMTIDQWKE